MYRLFEDLFVIVPVFGFINEWQHLNNVNSYRFRKKKKEKDENKKS